ncbi:MAG: DUF192 domain-containing protein [Candidatus Omnitrophica bacterium]|nr:DUF192 domain-containing protein [Candidatus Omnitrophota bacterium]
MIARRVRFADSFFLKLRGLMFEKKERFDYALVFPFEQEKRLGASIHMLFVFFPITAAYLDSKKRVVDVAVVKPFSLNYTPKKAAKYLIELPKEKARLLAVGDFLEF